MLFNLYRIIRFIYSKIGNITSSIITKILFYIHNINIDGGFKSNGIPKLSIHSTGEFKIGINFKMNNTIMNNPIGRSEKCMFIVRENALLSIGNNVGMSGATIVCQKEIIIKDDVKIGGNVCIYDTDFHSLHAKNRKSLLNDKKYTKRRTIIIRNNVFIGAHSTILKGVVIGDNSIVGACSVVTKSIPANEIWAGNPAKFIKKTDDN